MKPMAENSLSRDVFAKLSERILHWEYAPGQRLTEELLCAEFNVSRSPIREALQMLADRNLIDKKPRQGYLVKQLNLTEITELYEVRSALETHVMERVCAEGMAEAPLLELELEWTRLLHNLPGMDNYPVGEDEAFHRTFAEATGNQALQTMLQGINDRIRFMRASDIRTPQRMRDTCLEHLEIIDAVRRHDSARAIALVRRNIEAGRASVQAALKEALVRAHERLG
jgi:DNA-binding GntR family transcriptional regulator